MGIFTLFEDFQSLYAILHNTNKHTRGLKSFFFLQLTQLTFTRLINEHSVEEGVKVSIWIVGCKFVILQLLIVLLQSRCPVVLSTTTKYP